MEKVFAIRNMRGEFWTQQAAWGKIPKLYPSAGRVNQTIKYHAPNLNNVDIVEYELKEIGVGCVRGGIPE